MLGLRRKWEDAAGMCLMYFLRLDTFAGDLQVVDIVWKATKFTLFVFMKLYYFYTEFSEHLDPQNRFCNGVCDEIQSLHIYPVIMWRINFTRVFKYTNFCAKSVNCSFRVRVILRPAASQPVYRAVKHPPGAQDQILVTVAGLVM
jgi:hypothetical protein